MHIHALVPDGVFVEEDARLRFVPAPIPTRADIQRVAEELAARVRRTCLRSRRSLESSDEEELHDDVLDALARLGQEAVMAPTDWAEQPSGRHRRWIGHHLGVEVHAGVTADRGDRQGRERRVRYIARPALALPRLSLDGQGRVLLQFKRAWRNGTVGVRLPAC